MGALLGQMPRVAVLFELRHDMVGHGIALALGQGLPQPTHGLAGADKRIGQVVTQYIPAGSYE